MSSSACCSARDAKTSECHWNREHGFKCDLTVKANGPTRRKREFTPEELKDDSYWMKRSRNNEAAKRSRERRRTEERHLEERALQLLRENEKLKAALSAINYYGVGKETSYDAFMDYYPPARELPRDSYRRALGNVPGTDRAPHYSLSNRCDFTSACDSVPLPRMQSFPAAVGNTLQRDRYLGMHAPSGGNVPSSAWSKVPYAITQSKWGQGHAHSTINFYANSAPFFLNELVPGYPCPLGTAPRCAAHTRVKETYVEQRSFEPEPKDLCKEMEIRKQAEQVSPSPLLPHKLRYKTQKARAQSSAGVPHYIQD